MLDATLAGDVGFDPVGFANSRAELYNLREAEVKHGRLAMLAAAGWPMAELWHPGLSSLTGLKSELAEGGRAPAVLNGGLPQVGGFMAAVFLASAALEMATMDSQAWGKKISQSRNPPGYYGFDPLNWYTSFMALSKVDPKGPNYE